MSHSEVVCVGLHCGDIIVTPVPYLPSGQDQILVEDILWTVAGTAAATAVDLARLGVTVSSVGAVGPDSFGEMMATEMRREGVDTHLTAVPGYATSSSILPVSPTGDRPALFLLGACDALTLDMMPRDVIEHARVLHLGGTLLLPRLDGEPSAELLRRAKAAGAITTLDFIPDDRPGMLERLAPCLPHVDYLLPNLEEGMLVAGASTREEAIAFYLDQGVGCVIITMGEDGVSVTEAGERERIFPAYDVQVADTIGCGDALSAGFITGLLEDGGLDQAIELGLACGSLAATRRGSLAALTDRPTVDAFRAAMPRKPKASIC